MSEINESQGSSNGDEQDNTTTVLEVVYNDSPTKLFLAIEEMNWDDAIDILEYDPHQVRTWVRSKGSENTTFDWSVWRRLPIHEVCFILLLSSTFICVLFCYQSYLMPSLSLCRHVDAMLQLGWYQRFFHNTPSLHMRLRILANCLFTWPLSKS